MDLKKNKEKDVIIHGVDTLCLTTLKLDLV